MIRKAGSVCFAVLLTVGAGSPVCYGQPEPSELRAQLSPLRYTTLSSELAAKVEKLTVREGERFTQGQTLVAMECSLQRASHDKARAALSAAERLYTVNKQLHEMKAGGGLEAEMAAAEMLKAKAEVSASAAVLAKCSISAPFAGRVADLRIREQQFVQPGAPLLEILDDTALEIEFLAPSRWLSWLKVGSSFAIAVDETGKSYKATVVRLGARVDPVSQSVKVVGEIASHNTDLMAGMSGRIQITPPAGAVSPAAAVAPVLPGVPASAAGLPAQAPAAGGK